MTDTTFLKCQQCGGQMLKKTKGQNALLQLIGFVFLLPGLIFLIGSLGLGSDSGFNAAMFLGGLVPFAIGYSLCRGIKIWRCRECSFTINRE